MALEEELTMISSTVPFVTVIQFNGRNTSLKVNAKFLRWRQWQP